MQTKVLSACCVLLCTIVTAALLLTSSPAFAGEPEALLDILLKKGLISKQEYDELAAGRETAGREEAAASAGTELPDRVKVEGALEGEYRWMRHGGSSAGDSASDLYLRSLELSTGIRLNEWISASSVLISEWIGDELNAGDEMLTVDEAFITLQDEGFPLYIVTGKRTQPFGLFESHLITDPMTQDGYETKRVGLTAGLTGPAGTDLSVTVYKGEEQMNHLFESGLFDTESISRTGGETNDVGSFIVSASASPLEDTLTIFAAYLSEPGSGGRNETLNAGFNLVPPFLESLRLDAEYMKALRRERYDGAGREFREGVISVAAAYELILREREIIGGGLFEERRAHIVSEPLEVSLRYEYFDDGGLTADTGAWSVKYRFSTGARYSFYNDEPSGLIAFAAVEYRHTGTRAAGKNDEFYAKMGINF